MGFLNPFMGGFGGSVGGAFGLKPPAPAGFGGMNYGDMLRPQVQDPWGRSPSDPEYGMPPGGWGPKEPGGLQPNPGQPYDQGQGLQPMPGGIPPPSGMPTMEHGPNDGWGQLMPQQPSMVAQAMSQWNGPGGITTQRPANNGASLYALGGGMPYGGTSQLPPHQSQGFSSPLGSFIRRR